MTDTPTPTRDPALDRPDPTNASMFAGPYTATEAYAAPKKGSAPKNPKPSAEAAAVLEQFAAAPDPRGLNDEQRAVHREVQAKAIATGSTWKDALHAIANGGIPRKPFGVPGMTDSEEGADYVAAHGLAAKYGLDPLDTVGALRMFRDHEVERAQNLGDPNVPWLDTGIISDPPPRPWSDEDFERDTLRASTAGLPALANEKPYWEASARLGRDYVGEAAAAKRADTARQHADREVAHLRRARATEDSQRTKAINDELDRRAQERLASPGRRR